MDRLTIGKLAEAAGVKVSTLRYYERRNLIRAAERTSGNYRVFGKDAVERVRFIRAAQASGFTLDDVAALLSFIDGESVTCGEVRVLIEERLAAVRDRLRELRRLERTLEAAREKCQRGDPDGACEVVVELWGERRASGRRKKSQ